MEPLKDLFLAAKRLQSQVMALAVQRSIMEGIDKDKRLTTFGDAYFGRLLEFALFKCAFYECYTCKRAYYGGLRDCEDMVRQANFDKKDLICPDCVPDLNEPGLQGG